MESVMYFEDGIALGFSITNRNVTNSKTEIENGTVVVLIIYM